MVQIKEYGHPEKQQVNCSYRCRNQEKLWRRDSFWVEPGMDEIGTDGDGDKISIQSSQGGWD